MKIAHIVSTFPPYAGGMGNSAAAMVRELARLGHEVTVFTPYVATRGTLVSTRVPLVIRYMRPLFRVGNAAFVPQLFLDLDSFDIVHLHYPFFGGAEAALLHHFTRLRQPFLVHYQMDTIADGWKGRVFDAYRRFFLPKILKAAHRVLVSSDDYADHSFLRQYDVVSSKRVTIPLGVDTNRFTPQEKDIALLRQWKCGERNPVILFVGGLDRAHAFKGIDVLLRSFKFLLEFRRGSPDVSPHLLLVGDGDLKLSYQKLARELGIAEHVSFVGKVTDDNLPRYYSIADVVVLPSTNSCEAWGLVLLEGMASGKPVVASGLPGVRTLVRHGQNGLLVKPGDIVGLGKALNELLVNPILARAMGERGRKIVETEYRWEDVGKQLDALYRSLC